MLHEIRYSIRSLLGTPAITGAAISTVALALGATTALLMMVNAVVWQPLPIRDHASVFVLHQQKSDDLQRTFSYARYERLRQQLRDSVAAISASGTRAVRLTVSQHTVTGNAVFAAPDYFDVVGLTPSAGRFFLPSDHEPGAEATAVITDAFWRTRLGGDLRAIGGRLQLNGKPVLIIGVAPRFFGGMRLTTPADVFVPLHTAPTFLPPANYFAESRILINGRGYSPQSWLEIIARMPPAADVAQAEARASAALETQPSGVRASTGRFVSSSEAALPPGVQQSTRLFTKYLAGIVSAIWLTGCATLAALLISRSELRRREMAVRVALGAGRLGLSRLVAWDIAAICVIAGVLAWCIAIVIIGTLESFVLPGGIRVSALHLDGDRSGLTFAAIAVLTTFIASAILPVSLSHRLDVISGLKASDSRVSGHTRARSAIVSLQVAVTCVLLTAAGLFIRSVHVVNAMQVGPDVERVLYAHVSYTATAASAGLVASAYNSAVANANGLPWVERSTYGGMPLASNSGSNRAFTVDGVERVLADTLIFDCGPDYFATVGIPLVEGRDFGPAETSGVPRVVVVNETLARLLWPGRSAIGKRISFLPHEQPLEVIGVARDGKYVSIGEEARLALYQPWTPESPGASPPALVIARVSGPESASSHTALRDAIRAGSPDLVPTRTSTMRQRIAELTVVQRFGATVAGWLGGAALLIATAGLFGLVASSTTRRRREIGIRLALGGTPRRLMTMMVITAVQPVVVGLILGLFGSIALARLASAFLLGVTPADPATYLGAIACLGLVSALSSYAAARRVKSVDANELIRTE